MNDYFDRVESQLGALIEAGAHRRRRLAPRLMLPRARFGGAVAFAASAAIVAVVAAVLLVTLHHRPNASAPAVSDAAIDHSLVANYKLLRRPLTRGDQLPGGYTTESVAKGRFPRTSDWLQSFGRPPSLASIQLLPSLTRRTTIPGTEYSAWLIPGRHGMCWLTEGAGNSPPNPAVCVGSLQHPSTALVDGPWTDVETDGPRIVGLVTDRVRAVWLVTADNRHVNLPLHDGFYVSRLPVGHQQLIAITRSGPMPLYPQRMVPPRHVVADSATKVISRTSRPRLVLEGTPGLRVDVQWEMSCMSRLQAVGSSQDTTPVKGYQQHADYRLPASVPVGFPAGSSGLPSCYLATTVSISKAARGEAKVTISTS